MNAKQISRETYARLNNMGNAHKSLYKDEKSHYIRDGTRDIASMKKEIAEQEYAIHEDERCIRTSKKWLHTIHDAERRAAERYIGSNTRRIAKARKECEYKRYMLENTIQMQREYERI